MDITIAGGRFDDRNPSVVVPAHALPAQRPTVVPLRGHLVPARLRPVLTAGEREYVAGLLAGLSRYPSDAACVDATALRVGQPLELPRVADGESLRRWLQAGNWLMDLRTRTVFAAGRPPGTFNIGQNTEFVSYAGWLLPPGEPIVIIGPGYAEVADAQAELARIQVAKHVPDLAADGPHPWRPAPLGHYAERTLADLGAAGQVTLVDVRLPEEFALSHLPDAVNVPLAELADRIDELPPGPLWVCCGSGYRAAIGAAILAPRREGVVCVDDVLPPAEALA